MENSPQYVIEMLHITKEFPGIKASSTPFWGKMAPVNPR